MQVNELGLLIHHCTLCLITETLHLDLPPFLLAPWSFCLGLATSLSLSLDISLAN